MKNEAHRSINGNARAVFEYFQGYKLGLTATPKDYLKNFESDNPTTNDPREFERRLMRDTYKTFGCESRESTFRYSLINLHTNPSFNLKDYKEVPDRWRKIIPEYVKDYVPLNQFMN